MLWQQRRRDLLSNSLVIVVPNDSKLTNRFAERTDYKTEKIAIADPRAVPAAIYTKEYLSGLGLWDKVESKIVPTEWQRVAD